MENAAIARCLGMFLPFDGPANSPARLASPRLGFASARFGSPRLGSARPGTSPLARRSSRLALFKLFESSTPSTTRLIRPKTFTRFETKQDAATGRLLGFAELQVRAALLDIVAFMLDADSNYVQSLNAADPNVVRSEVLEKVGPHHTIVFQRFKSSAAKAFAKAFAHFKTPGISDRTFLNSLIAKQVADCPLTYVVAIVPIPCHDKVDRMDNVGAVRAELCRSFRCTEVEPGVTNVEYCVSLDMKGLLPQVVNAVAVRRQMRIPARAQMYFQQLRPLSECDKDDGRVVGRLLLDLVEGAPKDVVHAIRTFVNCTAMLRDCGFCHIGAMLAQLMTTNARDGPDNDAAMFGGDSRKSGTFRLRADPASVTEKQAIALGNAIASSVRQHRAPAQARISAATPNATMALRKVLNSHAVLGAMKSEYVWFVPMLEVLTMHKAAEARQSTVIKRLSSLVTRGIEVIGVAPIDATMNADGADAESGSPNADGAESSFRSVVRCSAHSSLCGCVRSVDDVLEPKVRGLPVPSRCTVPRQVPPDARASEVVAATLDESIEADSAASGAVSSAQRCAQCDLYACCICGNMQIPLATSSTGHFPGATPEATSSACRLVLPRSAWHDAFESAPVQSGENVDLTSVEAPRPARELHHHHSVRRGTALTISVAAAVPGSMQP
jgi:hypothetical protein